MVKQYFKPSVTASAIAMASLCFFVVLRGRKTEETLIRQQLDAVAAVVKTGGNDDAVAGISAIERSLRDLISDPLRIHMPDLPLTESYSLNDIAVYTMHFRAQFTRLNLSFYNMDIRFPEEKLAECTFTVLLAGTTPSEDRMLDARDVRAELKKTGGRWILKELEMAEVLRR